MLNTVFANDIRQTLDNFRRTVDQLFTDYNGYPADQPTANQPQSRDWTFSPALESAWDENGLWLRAILPGVNQNDVNVQLQGNQLVISGERKQPEAFGKNSFRQLMYGRFLTSVALPSGLDVEKVRCELRDGVLNIHIPVAEQMKPRQIQIQVSGGEQQKSIGV